MTTAVLNQNYHLIDSLINFFNPPESKKSISTIKKVICITTDKQSLDNSFALLDALSFCKTHLPQKNGFNISNAKKLLNGNNDNLSKINNFFATLENIFEGDQEVEIDDDNMISILHNLKKAKEDMEFISSYLNLILTVFKIKGDLQKGKSKKYSFDELIDELNAA